MYKGVMYIQDQIWNDECQYTCECQDASTGSYKCDERCVIACYVNRYTGILKHNDFVNISSINQNEYDLIFKNCMERNELSRILTENKI